MNKKLYVIKYIGSFIVDNSANIQDVYDDLSHAKARRRYLISLGISKDLLKIYTYRLIKESL